MASTQGGNFDFNAGADIDFTGFGMQPVSYNDLKAANEGNTSSAFFFGDEGIDTTGSTFEQSFDSMFAPAAMSFGMEPLVSIPSFFSLQEALWLFVQEQSYLPYSIAISQYNILSFACV